MTPSSNPPAPQAAEAQAQILIRRARELAQTFAEDALHDAAEVLLFRLGTERYAVRLELLRSVLAPMRLTAVPCAPPSVAGIVNVRGEVVTVIDLGTVLGLAGGTSVGATSERSRGPDPTVFTERWVILVQVPQGTVGLSVDEVLGMSKIAYEELDRSISGRDFVAGIHDGATVLLDLALLLTPERLDVFEPVT